MKSFTVDVTVQDKVVGQAAYSEFDSLAEALENLKEDEVLKLVNRGVKLAETNKVRAKAQGDTPARKIGRVARDLRKGKLDNAAAQNLIKDILASA